MAHTSAVLQFENLHKQYKSGQEYIEVLKGVSLDMAPGDICSLVGPSGSGKTTLLGIAVGLETASSGHVRLCGKDLAQLSEEGRAQLRNLNVGFVFQSFQLIPSLTALENVLIPAELSGLRDAKARAQSLLKKVGLADRGHHYPTQLSGGEQQRVSIARAFINEPKILLADEPTGNLDENTAKTVEELLFELHRELGTAVLIATHNQRLAAKAHRMLYLEHGSLRQSLHQSLRQSLGQESGE